MIKRFILILSATLCACAFSGCASTVQKNASVFLTKVAGMHVNVTDFSQHTVTPVYNHAESLTALGWAPDHSFSVANLKAVFNIPIPLLGIPILTWDAIASGISASPENAPAVATVFAQPDSEKTKVQSSVEKPK